MALNQILVLQDLPKFAGYPRPNEPKFVPDLDVRTFLRTIENYFAHHAIHDDDRKIQTLFSLIDKKRGNAITLLNCYAGKNISYAQLREEMLSMYPSFVVTEFRNAAHTLNDIKLNTADSFCSMTAMEAASRAVVESYLAYMPLTKEEIDVNTKVPVYETEENRRRAMVNAEDESGDDEDDEIRVRPPPLELCNLLQNFLLHYVLGLQLGGKLYSKMAGLGPRLTSTKLMSETVKTIERQKLLSQTNRPVKRDDTTTAIWSINNSRNQPPQPQRSQPQSAPRYQPPQPQRNNQQQQSNQRTQSQFPPSRNRDGGCFNCGELDHRRKDCPRCGYCLKPNHRAKECRLRIKEAKGKFCQKCRMKDSHSTHECRRRSFNPTQNRVNMIQNVDGNINTSENGEGQEDVLQQPDNGAAWHFDSNEETDDDNSY